MVVVQPEVPPAVALTDNIPVDNDDGGEEPYDNYGNYIGDKGGEIAIIIVMFSLHPTAGCSLLAE